MKAKKYLLPAVLTVLALLVGFFMPDVLSAVQERYSRSDIGFFETDSVTLDFSSDLSISDKLELLGSLNPNLISLDRGKETDYDEMLRIIERYIVRFEESILPVGAYKINTLTPFDAVFEDGAGPSFVLWSCSISTETGANVDMILDDLTGCILSFSYIQAGTIKATDIPLHDPQFYNPEKLIWVWANVYAESLGFTLTDISPVSAVYDDYLSDEIFLYEITFSDQDGQSFVLAFRIEGFSDFFIDTVLMP